MQHGHQEPLGQLLAIGAAKLRHVGVYGQLLARYQDVGIDDRRDDDVAARDLLRGLLDRRVFHERFDTRRLDVAAVRIRFAKIIGSLDGRAGIVGIAAAIDAGRYIVKRRIEALRQLLAEALVRAFVSVGTEGAE